MHLWNMEHPLAQSTVHLLEVLLACSYEDVSKPPSDHDREKQPSQPQISEARIWKLNVHLELLFF